MDVFNRAVAAGDGPVIRNKPIRPLSEFGDCLRMTFSYGFPMGG